MRIRERSAHERDLLQHKLHHLEEEQRGREERHEKMRMEKDNQIGELRRQLREAVMSSNEGDGSSGGNVHASAHPAPGQPNLDSARHVSSLQAAELSKMSDEIDALRADREGKIATLHGKISELQRELEEKSNNLSNMEKLLFSRDKENNTLQYENEQIRSEVQTWREKARLTVEEASSLRDQLRENVHMMDKQRAQMVEEQQQQQRQQQQQHQEEKQQQQLHNHQQQHPEEHKQIHRLQAQLSHMTQALEEEKDKVSGEPTRWISLYNLA